MFLAAAYAYKYHPDECESAKEEAYQQLEILRTRSNQVVDRYWSNTAGTMMTIQDGDEVAIAEQAPPTVLHGVFRNDVRQEWIDAMFGKDFYATATTSTTATASTSIDDKYIPPRQGSGNAGIASYVTYGCTIPAQQQRAEGEGEEKKDQGQKVGVTLARMALGLYVHHVEVGSQAQFTGVLPGSILVDINGMGLLGEPSRQALERLWQYEGHFVNSTNKATKQQQEQHQPLGPIAMKFYHHGETYTKIFVSSPPFGISWAPCGNFALVQRTYALAAQAGARRGCLVAAVGATTIRHDLDHEVAAAALRDLFVSGQTMELQFCYTPAASRSGFMGKSANNKDAADNRDSDNKNPNKKERRKVVASSDGVEVRIHPLEYRSLFNCVGVGNTRSATIHQEQQDEWLRISELAARVVAGHVVAPTGVGGNASVMLPPLPPKDNNSNKVRRRQSFTKCPPLDPQLLLSKWNAMDALVYCLQIHQANYDADAIVTTNGSLSSLDMLRKLLLQDANMANAFLLQWVSLLCIPEEETAATDLNDSIDSVESACYSKELASMLLAMSRSDDDFCQRLHFLLRSYTCTLETQRKKDDSTRNLLTLLQALERLRTAQRQLASQLTTNNNNTLRRIRANSVDNTPKSNSDVLMIESQDEGMLLTTSTSSNSPTDASGSFLPRDSSATPSKKQKSVFKLFRKKNKDASKTNAMMTTPIKKYASTSDLPSLSPAVLSNSPMASAPLKVRTSSLTNLSMQLEYLSVSSLLENMTRFLTELDGICDTIERSLLKSISQKIADWALQPWSASKESELTKVTEGMRAGLSNIMKSDHPPSPLVNPVESREVLVSIDSNECYILPSAHFPLLLTFNVDSNNSNSTPSSSRPSQQAFLKDEQIYRTRVEVVAIRGSASPMKPSNKNGSVEGERKKELRAYEVQGAVAGIIHESGRSTPLDKKSKIHSWGQGGKMTFDTRSCWGAPNTLSLAVSTVEIGDDGREQLLHTDDKGKLHYVNEVGHCWVDMKPLWDRVVKANSKSSKKVPPTTITCHAQIWSLDQTEPFDQHGDIPHGMAHSSERLELELRVTTELLKFNHPDSGYQSRKRMLLYKHNDDLRQEMFAIQFIDTCGNLLKASGLDLKLLTFRCIPVGAKRGFIEWIPGSVPLSDICQPFGSRSIFTRSPSDEKNDNHKASATASSPGRHDPLSEVAKSCLNKYQSLQPRIKPSIAGKGQEQENALDNNPVQSFLRSGAYDPDAPYFIRREVMDNYVKSCAGYCVLTYLLGVGDRHLDNLLLHQEGYFFHCDYSFILGNDPKKYLPMRITEDMVHGMGGRESDNYAMFLSLAGATFNALRRHENVRVILSLVRLMAPSGLPDVSVNQSPEQVLHDVLERLCLNLSDEEAISYMEQLIEDSICSKLWIAVDAMHSIGKRF